ncbi:unnamed protein product [Caenorhabditis bovis]|uniref:Domain of unknown function DX domain-containing protein n=1 Tax=Caenorhabditis bovis TaxID=2654633 RepID=A0A8S1FDW8_9PELO|nr:unnamed protein product [Caenorhabditis bovis]
MRSSSPFAVLLIIRVSIGIVVEPKVKLHTKRNRLFEDNARRVDSGCRWFGTAPFCYETCPSDYDFIRQHSGRCANGGSCVPDASFGEPCIKIFSYQMTKKFCCKSDPVDCSWSGRWMGSEDAFNFYCRFDPEQGTCGRLECSVNNAKFKAHNSSYIEGPNCDELQMWNLRGKATCGYIAWFQNGEHRNSWYKTF